MGEPADKADKVAKADKVHSPKAAKADKAAAAEEVARRRIRGKRAPVHFDLVGTEAFDLTTGDSETEGEERKRKSSSGIVTALPAMKRIRITSKRPG